MVSSAVTSTALSTSQQEQLRHVDSMLSSGAERRGAPRFNCQLPVRVTYATAAGELADFFITAVDLSRGGIQLVSQAPLTLQQRVIIYLPAPSKRIVTGRVVSCRAARRRGYAIGVQFTASCGKAAGR